MNRHLKMEVWNQGLSVSTGKATPGNILETSIVEGGS